MRYALLFLVWFGTHTSVQQRLGCFTKFTIYVLMCLTAQVLEALSKLPRRLEAGYW